MLSSVSRCSQLRWRSTFRLLSASLLQAMRLTDNVAPFTSRRSAVIGAFRSSHRSIVLASSLFLSGLLLYRFPVVVFFDRAHSCFRNFNSAIPVEMSRSTSQVTISWEITHFTIASNAMKATKQMWKILICCRYTYTWHFFKLEHCSSWRNKNNPFLLVKHYYAIQNFIWL